MKEHHFFKNLTKNQKRFLSKHVCLLCNMELNKNMCGSIYGGCTEDLRIDRAKRCLKTYKPRKRNAVKSTVKE